MDNDTLQQLLGLSQKHLVEYEEHFLIHQDIQKDLEQLSLCAHDNGHQLKLVSSFRSFESQLSIWNQKALGKRALLDLSGKALDYDSLNEEEILFAILRWSALPGMSRHHWGTDLDVYDHQALPSKEYQIQLSPDEVSNNGPFGPFHQWLDHQILNNQSFHFFRPYERDQGGVAPERWHLSHLKTSEHYFKQLDIELFEYALQNFYSELELYELVWKKRELIYKQYITNLCLPQWPATNQDLA